MHNQNLVASTSNLYQNQFCTSKNWFCLFQKLNQTYTYKYFFWKISCKKGSIICYVFHLEIFVYELYLVTSSLLLFFQRSWAKAVGFLCCSRHYIRSISYMRYVVINSFWILGAPFFYRCCLCCSPIISWLKFGFKSCILLTDHNRQII